LEGFFAFLLLPSSPPLRRNNLDKNPGIVPRRAKLDFNRTEKQQAHKTFSININTITTIRQSI
jgi:hypothetical protein